MHSNLNLQLLKRPRTRKIANIYEKSPKRLRICTFWIPSSTFYLIYIQFMVYEMPAIFFINFMFGKEYFFSFTVIRRKFFHVLTFLFASLLARSSRQIFSTLTSTHFVSFFLRCQKLNFFFACFSLCNLQKNIYFIYEKTVRRAPKWIIRYFAGLIF